MDSLKKFSPAVFAVIITCFFLPFINISCGGQTVINLTGFQLITGADYVPANSFGNDFFDMEYDDEQMTNKSIESQPLAVISFVCALAGFVFSFIKKKTSSLITMFISAAGAIFLLLLKADLDGDITAGSELIVELNYLFAFWFSFLLFMVGAVLQWFTYKEQGYTVTGNPTVTSG